MHFRFIILTIAIFGLGFLPACNTSGPKERKEQDRAEEHKTTTSQHSKSELEASIAACLKHTHGIPGNSSIDSSAKSCLALIETYLRQFPDAQQKPDYLVAAADLHLKSLNNPKAALRYYQVVFKRYSEHEQAPTALFMAAYLLDNHLANDEAAGKHYQSFVAQYPDHPMAQSARLSLRYLGKSDQEIIEEFQQKKATQ